MTLTTEKNAVIEMINNTIKLICNQKLVDSDTMVDLLLDIRNILLAEDADSTE